MRIALVTALATVSLLGACRQGEQSPSTNAASNEASAPAAPNAPAAPAAPVTPQAAQQIFHERHEGMEDIGKATKTIKQALDSGTPDLAAIKASAAKIDELASKSSGWFPAGTGQEVEGLHKTRALPAIWQKPDDFAAKDRDFLDAAHALKAAADQGNLDAIKSSFGTLGKACKAGHDTYRAEEHPK